LGVWIYDLNLDLYMACGF